VTWAMCRSPARHADSRTTISYGRARNHLNRHPSCILAAHMAQVPDQARLSGGGSQKTPGIAELFARMLMR
jgi:hypothetical protein